MTKAMQRHRHRGRVTLAVLKKLGANSNISEAEITALEALLDSQEPLEVTRDDTETDWKGRGVQVERQGRSLWRSLSKWYRVARATVADNLQHVLDVIKTGHSYTLARVENRARQTNAALSQLPEGFTAANLTKTALLAEIASMLDALKELEDLHSAYQAAQTNLDNADAALDAENKRLYAILDALYDVVGTLEYDQVHTIPTEGEDDEEEDDGGGAAPSLPPER